MSKNHLSPDDPQNSINRSNLDDLDFEAPTYSVGKEPERETGDVRHMLTDFCFKSIANTKEGRGPCENQHRGEEDPLGCNYCFRFSNFVEGKE